MSRLFNFLHAAMPATAETADDRNLRLAREADRLEQARQDLRAGRIVAEAEMEAWFRDALEDAPALSPKPR